MSNLGAFSIDPILLSQSKLPNACIVDAAITVLCGLSICSIKEDLGGVVQDDFPAILKALVELNTIGLGQEQEYIKRDLQITLL